LHLEIFQAYAPASGGGALKMTNLSSQDAFYASPSPTSDLSRHAAAVAYELRTTAEAARTACNVVLHVAASGRSGVRLTEERLAGLDVRSAARIVDHVLARKNAPLTVRRQPRERMIGNCHHISLLTCALLRAAGKPVRARVGFASYLEPGKWTDHWVCEVFRDGGWKRFDPDGGLELDGRPNELFLSASEAWAMCRSGDADPERFGFEDARGWWFVRNNVVRDFAALCKVELLPWDFWGLMVGQDSDRPDELIDELAEQCLDDEAWEVRVRRYADDPLVNPRGRVFVFRGGAQEIVLPDIW
jgi:transglutaminase-like putative cysteine protease